MIAQQHISRASPGPEVRASQRDLKTKAVTVRDVYYFFLLSPTLFILLCPSKFVCDVLSGYFSRLEDESHSG